MRTESSSIGYGVIGTGKRFSHLIGHLAGHHGRLSLRGVYDPSSQRADAAVERFGGVAHPTRDALLADPTIDWVLVLSPNYIHRDDIVACFEAGKHVFAEKPLATTVQDCVAIHDAHERHPQLKFATGFVLRYAPICRKVKALLDEGFIGDILSIAACENITPPHGGHIMSCWRRDAKLSGSHMLEKCCHDLDLLLWFTGSLPTAVASFGGNDLFVPERGELMERFTPPPGHRSIYLSKKNDTRDTDNPFTAEKSIIDNQVAVLEFANRVRVTFQATLNNAIPERRLYFSGSEGNVIAELYSMTVQARRIGHGEPLLSWDFTGGDGHGGGDRIIMDELAATMADNAPVICGGAEGLRSAVVSLAIEQARLENRVVDLTETWRRLGIAP